MNSTCNTCGRSFPKHMVHSVPQALHKGAPDLLICIQCIASVLAFYNQKQTLEQALKTLAPDTHKSTLSPFHQKQPQHTPPPLTGIRKPSKAKSKSFPALKLPPQLDPDSTSIQTPRKKRNTLDFKTPTKPHYPLPTHIAKPISTHDDKDIDIHEDIEDILNSSLFDPPKDS
jgi:hypothetical protein